MNEKSLSLDLLEKGTNLCQFLQTEKSEMLLSSRFFDALCKMCESCYSLKNPTLAKTELSALRKAASLEADKISLYLDSLLSLGYISRAQRESMAKSVDIVKKETNI